MIAQIGHCAYRVRDAAKSTEFYARLGIVEAFRLHREDGSLGIVYLQLSANQFIEIFPGATQPATATRETIGYAHLCLLVDDLHAMIADLDARGVVIDRPIKRGADGNLQAWIVDPDGNRIELMQIMPDSLQAKAAARADR
ncbi:MAG: VOC family protein [Chloroflexi bacterium]|nr:VOC family protein [Chloroflexota bacterium]